MKTLKLVNSVLTAATLAVVMPALAATSADAFTLTFDSFFGTSNSQGTGATAQVDFTFIDIDADNTVLLVLGIDNTTDEQSSFINGVATSGATEATFMGFAFDLLDGVSIQSYTGSSSFGNSSSNINLPPFSNREDIGIFDVGIHKNNNFIGGNPNGGLTAGNTTGVSFFLNSNLTATELESGFLTGFTDGSLDAVARFQAVNAGAGSDKLLGGILPPEEVEDPIPPDDEYEFNRDTEIPEPSALAGLGLVFGSLFAGLRRKKRQ